MIYQETRPANLEEVVGNESAVKALQKEIKAEKHSHIFLFSGPSGCGKTTLARILANEFGCLPINIIEKNAASERGIDMIRDLENVVQYTPMGGGSRAIILDECHSLTKDAQNASLKIFEDIPSYQYFFLCTTEPKKVLNTIRTRCNQVSVKILTAKDIGYVLDDACEKLGIIEISDDVFEAIAKTSEGCPRTALVLLEKTLNLSESDAIRAVHAYKAPEKQIIDLCRALVKGSWNNVKEIYKQVLEEETDTEKIRYACLGYLHSCLLKAEGDRTEGDRIDIFADMIGCLEEPTFYSLKAGLLRKLWCAYKKNGRYFV